MTALPSNHPPEPLPHPSAFLSSLPAETGLPRSGSRPAPSLAAILRQHTTAAEQRRALHPDQLSLIYDQRWFRLFIPDIYGGRPLSLPAAARLEEGIAWADGATGWTVTLCAGAGWFAGFFPKHVFSDIFSDPRLCLAGSGAPSGEAIPVPGGYRITGRWEYASGAHQATAFTANCVIKQKDGPIIRPFLFKKEEVRVLDTWNTIGLVASGSHTFEVNDLAVPADRCFIIDPAHPFVDQPLYHYPFLPLAEVTLAANLSGMAVHFLDHCQELFPQRQHTRHLSPARGEEMNTALRQAIIALQGKRQEFYTLLDQSWQVLTHTNHIPAGLLGRLSLASRSLAITARQVTDNLYPYTGLSSARPDSAINHVWRDIHTASQHSLLAFQSPA